MAVMDTFEQIQHGSNPSLAILTETFRSSNYCCHNQEGRFLGCAPLLYIWIRSLIFLWKNHLHEILLSRGSSYHRILPECLAHTKDGRIVGFISLRPKLNIVDGPMDVPTPATILMHEPILDTLFRTMKDDQLCSTPRFEAIQGQTVHFSYCRASLVRDHLWQAWRGLIA